MVTEDDWMFEEKKKKSVKIKKITYCMYYSFYIFMPVILGLTVLFNAQTLRIIKHKKIPPKWTIQMF